MDRITNVRGGGDLQKIQELLSDPTWPSSTLSTFVDARLELLRDIDEERQIDSMQRKVVSVRLSVSDIHMLDQIAKRLDETRSGLATVILEIGIEELRAKLAIPRVFSTQLEGDSQTTTLKDGQTGQVLGSYQDDAVQIGGDDK